MNTITPTKPIDTGGRMPYRCLACGKDRCMLCNFCHDKECDHFMEPLTECNHRFLKPDQSKDSGHTNLVNDIEHLLIEVKNKEFHDFENDKHALPKMVLVSELEKLIARAKNGWYDN